MSDQPRLNESRFYRYPKHRLVAVLDDTSQLDTALTSLRQVGIDVSAVNVLTGLEGARLLDRRGTSHGLRGRLLRLLQRGAYEGDALDLHERALQQGGHVLYVPVRGEGQRATVVDVLRAAGGHHLLYFARWSVEQL